MLSLNNYEISPVCVVFVVLSVKFYTFSVLQNLHINIWHSLEASALPFFSKNEVFLLISEIQLHREPAKL